jgi:hypothetical protein
MVSTEPLENLLEAYFQGMLVPAGSYDDPMFNSPDLPRMTLTPNDSPSTPTVTLTEIIGGPRLVFARPRPKIEYDADGNEVRSNYPANSSAPIR